MMGRRAFGRLERTTQRDRIGQFSLSATLEHYEVEELSLAQASRLLEQTQRHRARVLEAADVGSLGRRHAA